jgi:hypothetical protein
MFGLSPFLLIDSGHSLTSKKIIALVVMTPRVNQRRQRLRLIKGIGNPRRNKSVMLTSKSEELMIGEESNLNLGMTDGQARKSLDR